MRAGRPACSASITSRSQCLGDRVAVAAAGDAHHALEPALGLLEVGEHQLGLDRLDVVQRVDPSLRVDDALVGVGADDVDDRVGLADVGQELVARPSPLCAPATRPAMSWKAIVSHTIFDARTVSDTRTMRSSVTGTIARFGSIVVNG